MQNKPALKFYLGLVFLGLGCWKLYEKYVLGNDISTLQLIGSIFLVALGLYRAFEYYKHKNIQP